MDRSSGDLHQARAALLAGFASGLRSQIVFPFLGVALRQSERRRADFITGWADIPELRKLAILSAMGELAVDKLPFTPDRRNVWPLTGRLVFGALAGAMVAVGSGVSLSRGALHGALGAFAGTHAGYWSRRWLVAATGLPDPIIALAEDLAAVAIAVHAVRQSPELSLQKPTGLC